MKKSLVIMGLMALLMGCSMFSDIFHHQTVVKNRQYDYLQSRNTPPLQTPVGVSNGQFGNDYPVPGYTAILAQPASEIPPGSSLAH